MAGRLQFAGRRLGCARAGRILYGVCAAYLILLQSSATLRLLRLQVTAASAALNCAIIVSITKRESQTNFEDKNERCLPLSASPFCLSTTTTLSLSPSLNLARTLLAWLVRCARCGVCDFKCVLSLISFAVCSWKKSIIF